MRAVYELSPPTRIFLNLGTHASIPPIPGLRECGPLTNIETLELDVLPDHLVVLGGGYVGLEFAQAYRRFGSRVTILQRSPHLIDNQDADVSQEIQRILSAEGVDVVTSADLVQVEGSSGAEVRLAVRVAGTERNIVASHILVATGRTPNTAGIGLEAAGTELVGEGGDSGERSPGNHRALEVWAIGECAGSPQFTHASLDDFRIIRDNLAGGNRTTRGRLMPSCLFTDPQVAHVGLTETEAKRMGIAAEVARAPMSSVLRTQTISETQGFMKALIAPGDGRILGFTMVGAEAGEVMGVVQMAMQGSLPYTALRDSVLAHPTMAEGLNVLFSTVKMEVPGLARPASASAWPQISRRRIEADGLLIFYRESGPADAPVVLLLHGFPASSFQFRELMPRLADRYRVIAPDLPGFGFTDVPEQRRYVCIASTRSPKPSKHSPMPWPSRATRYMFLTTARPPDSGWRWRGRSESRASFRKTAMRTKRVWGTRGLPSGITGANRRGRTVKLSGRPSTWPACGESIRRAWPVPAGSLPRAIPWTLRS